MFEFGGFRPELEGGRRRKVQRFLNAGPRRHVRRGGCHLSHSKPRLCPAANAALDGRSRASTKAALTVEQCQRSSEVKYRYNEQEGHDGARPRGQRAGHYMAGCCWVIQ